MKVGHQFGITYPEFSRLRIDQFWPKGTQIHELELISCFTEYGSGQGVGWCCFLWPPDKVGEVSEIRLEQFGPDDCPPEVASKIFAAVNVPASVGISRQQATDLFGEPDEVLVDDIGDHCTFTIGPDHAKYRLNCVFSVSEGLVAFQMWRADREGQGD